MTICILGLENVEIHQNTVEDEDGNLECAIFRALRPFTDKKLFRTIWKKIKLGGALCAYKGRIMHAKLELTGLLDDPVLSNMAAHAKITPVWVPFLEEERCLVIARKTLNI
jgi:16S rRNA G527 N7-methylase RsmG